MVVPLDSAIVGQQSQDTIHWTDTLREQSGPPRKPYQRHKAITLPRPSDQLWIVTHSSVTKCEIGATLYVSRNHKLLLLGYFSAQLRKLQDHLALCEVEALGIATVVKYFSSFLIQSIHKACVLTYSRPCVQAIH